jgi:hypothetical protein
MQSSRFLRLSVGYIVPRPNFHSRSNILSSEQPQARPPAAKTSGGIGQALKTTLRSMVRAIPGGQNTIEPFLRKSRLQMRQWVWSLKANEAATEEKDNLLLVDPADIVFLPKTEFAYSQFKGVSKAGDWDQSDQHFDQLDIYQAFKDVCKDKTKSWPETAYYKAKVAQIEGGKPFHGCKTREEFDARCEDLSAIYDSMAAEGYKSQAEIGGDIEGEVSVAIDRDGRLMFSDGAHRLSMAKLLGVSEIPVAVAVRHSKWAAFKAQVQEFSRTQVLGSLYQQALHPDLLSVPAAHGCADRFEIINAQLPVKSGNLLDIGTNLAYMCQRFEDEGFDCTGIETDETHLYVLNKLRTAADKKFEVRAGSFLDDMEVTDKQFEVVLALNIFHHFLKEEADYKKLIAFLQKLKTNRIVFEPHLTSEPQMQTAFKNYPPEEFCAFVMEHTGMTKKERIFGAHDGREVFILSRCLLFPRF